MVKDGKKWLKEADKWLKEKDDEKEKKCSKKFIKLKYVGEPRRNISMSSFRTCHEPQFYYGQSDKYFSSQTEEVPKISIET